MSLFPFTAEHIHCSLPGKDNSEVPTASKDQQDKPESKLAPVIIIDDDEVQYVDVADMSCQATFEDIESETQAHHEKEKDKIQTQTTNSDISSNNLPDKPAIAVGSTQQSGILLTATLAKATTSAISKQSDVALSSVSSAGKAPPVIYRTLKSPVTSGAPLLPQRVALKSSAPSLPVQQTVSSVKPSNGTASSVVSPSEVRYSTTQR